MMQMLDDIWDEFITTCFNEAPPPDHQRLFLKISTLLFGLKNESAITADLFEVRLHENSSRLEKQGKLTLALDALQKKYQKETVWLGVVPKTLAGNVGTKIAFNRVPDKEEFQY
jgi:DNA polymerase-4